MALQKNAGDAPWVEKYRPLLLDDVVGNTETISRMKVIAVQGNCPNLLISGPPGIGKTTSIHCLARQMLGESYKDAVLELNASDDRGINVVRTKIKAFAQKKVSLPPGKHKFIILDEADSMTTGAQQALRRTMEIHSKTTRFALACNVSSKVIEPIQSRCAILRYARLSNQDILTRLLFITKAENIQYTNKGLEALLFTADGDLRNAINSLQATYSGFEAVTDVNVFKVCDEPHPGIIEEMMKACLHRDIDKAVGLVSSLHGQGYAAVDLIGTIFKVTKDMALPEKVKLDYIKEIGITHTRILEGVSSLVQLAGLCARLSSIQVDA